MSYAENYEEEDVTGFQDEPLEGEDGVSRGGPAFHFEGVDTALAKAERRRERRRRRYERIGMISIAVCCVCLIISLVLVFNVFKVTEKMVHDAFTLETDSPTIAPTLSPTRFTSRAPVPAPKPTISVMTPSPTNKKTPSPSAHLTASPTVTPQPSYGLQDTYETIAVEDTYLYLDGQNTGKSYGRSEKLLVQHGTKLSTKPGQMPDIPTSYSILKFDLSQVKNFPDRKRWPEEVKVNLFLDHTAKSDAEDFEEVRLDVYRIPNNYGQPVETWTGASFTSFPKSSREGVLISRTSFSPKDLMVTIDVTSIFELPEEDQGSGGFADDQILLKLLVSEGKPGQGEEFGSRESDESLPPRIQFVLG